MSPKILPDLQKLIYNSVLLPLKIMPAWLDSLKKFVNNLLRADLISGAVA